jgi:hypothetical protein
MYNCLLFNDYSIQGATYLLDYTTGFEKSYPKKERKTGSALYTELRER